MRIENLKFIDLARFMPGFKLSTLAKDFKCELQKDEIFSHDDIQLMYIKNGIEWVKKNHIEKIAQYNEQDVKVTL